MPTLLFERRRYCHFERSEKSKKVFENQQSGMAFFCPGGTSENSPAIYCRVSMPPIFCSPVGTAES